MTTEKKAERDAKKRIAAQQKQWADKCKKQRNDSEAVLWEHLRACQLGVNFRHQVALGDTKYVADFYCGMLRLNIEVDGGIHNTPERIQKDARRDAKLTAMGIKIVRIPAYRVKAHKMTRTIAYIRRVIEERQIELGGVMEA